MTYNSIYGNTFKIQNQNNLVKVPDFFMKLLNKVKNSSESREKNIYNRNQNKLNINNLQSYENNLQNVTKKNYDLIFNQKKRKIHERKENGGRRGGRGRDGRGRGRGRRGRGGRNEEKKQNKFVFNEDDFPKIGE